MIRILSLVLLSNFGLSTKFHQGTTTECPCGYGGLCLRNYDSYLDESCSLCVKISDGFYRFDCTTIVNHCQTFPCARGRCVPTFGGYFCNCPPGWMGQRCDINVTKILSDHIIKVYVHYQVQPGPKGEQQFTIALNENFPVSVFDTSRHISWKLIVELSNGPTYFPKFGSQFTRRNVKNECLLEAEMYPDLKDKKVCEYVPTGEVWAYTFDPSVTVPESNSSNFVHVPDFTSAVGQTGKVFFGIFLEKTGKYPQIFYLQQYTIFSYFYGRVPHSCTIDLDLIGCSQNKEKASTYTRASVVNIFASINRSKCTGGLLIGTNWYRQSLHFYEDIDQYQQKIIRRNKLVVDSTPEILPLFKNEKTLSLPPLFFYIGLTMFEIVNTMRGDPPHFGSPTAFDHVDHCWVNIVPGPLHIRAQGGSILSAYCHQPLSLQFESPNPGVLMTELIVKVACNHTDDEECKPSVLEIPMLTKFKTPCGRHYKFSVQYTLFTANGEITREMEIEVYFVNRIGSLKIECILNCSPFNYKSKSLLIAHSMPYDRNPVKWNVTWRNEDVASKAIDIHDFSPLSGSRILLLPENTFKLGKGDSESVNVTVESESGIYAEKRLLHDNLENKCRKFRYEYTGDGNYILVKNWSDALYPFFPLRYEIVEVNPLNNDSVVVLVSTRLNKIKFQPRCPSVQLCIVNGIHTKACCNIFNVKNVPTRETATYKDLSNAHKAHDTRWFLVELNSKLFRNLCGNILEPSFFKWRLSLKRRIELVKIFSHVAEVPLRFFEIESAFCIMSKLYMTELGARMLDMHPFVDEELNTIYKLSEWMQMRVLLTNTLIKFIRNPVSSMVVVDWPQTASMMNRILQVASLAFVTQALGTAWLNTYDPSINDFEYAFLTYQKALQHWGLIQAMNEFSIFISTQLPMYFGLNHFSNNLVGVWAIKSSYNGILYHLDRSHDVNLIRNSEKLFGPYSPDVPWLHYIDLKFPKKIHLFDSKELTLTATVFKHKLLADDGSPRVVLQVHDNMKEQIFTFYNNSPYYVALPIMNTGNAWETPFMDSTNRAPFSRSFGNYLAYKVTLPTSIVNYTIEFSPDKHIAYFKMKVDFYNLPTYEDVFDSQPEKCKIDANMTLHCSHHMQAPPVIDDDFSFYIGLILQNYSPVQLRFKTAFFVCKVDKGLMLWSAKTVCKALFDPEEQFIPPAKDGEKGPLMAHCECTDLGNIVATTSVVRFANVFTGLQMKQIPGNTPIFKITSNLVFFIIFLFVIILSVRRDKARVKKRFLNHLLDNYPSDSYTYILGVYTSSNLIAGTRAKVAIKVVGSNSSSKVHVLKSRPPRSLTMGSDIWYVMTTSKPLGNIVRLYVWQNYAWLSYWKCSRILIFDVENSNWFCTEPNKWMKIGSDNEESKYWTLNVFSLYLSAEKSDEIASKNFERVYMKELRNKHFFFSCFFLHERSFYSFTEKGSILFFRAMLTVLIVMCLHIWPLPEEMLYLFDVLKFFSCSAEIGRLLSISFVFAMVTRIITFPFVYFYRVCYMSRAFQKKCTLPLDSFIGYEGIKGFVTTKARHGYKSQDKIRFSRAQSDFQRASSSVGSPASRNSPILRVLNRLKFVLFAPCQFHCINFDSYAFQSNVEDTRKTMRFVTLSAAFVLLAIFITVPWYIISTRSDSCRLKKQEYVCNSIKLYLVIATFLTDVILWDPLIILVNTMFMIYFFKVHNQEWNFWGQDGRIPPKLFAIGREEYLETAVGDYYKPRLTHHIEKLRKKNAYKIISKELFFIGVLFAALYMGYRLILYHSIPYTYYHKRLFIQELSYGISGSNFSKENSVPIDEVDSVAKLREFLKYFIPWSNKWPNKKLINPEKGSHWVLDRRSKVTGTFKIYLLYMRTSEQLTMYQPLKPYFEYALGHLSDSNLETDPVARKKYALLQVSNTTIGYIYGKTGIAYPLKGQYFSLSTDSWMEFYTQYQYMCSVFQIYDKTHIMRALIVSSTYFNVNVPMLMTVDLVVEFLPSGVLIPKLDIVSYARVMLISITLYVCAMTAIALIMFIFIVVGWSDKGWSRYAKTPQFVTSFALLLIVVWVAVSFVAQQNKISSTINKVKFAVLEKSDVLEYVYTKQVFTSALLPFIGIICFYLTLVTKKFFGIHRLYVPLGATILPCCFSVVLIAVIAIYMKTSPSPLTNNRIPIYSSKVRAGKTDIFEQVSAYWILLWIMILKIIGGLICGFYSKQDDSQTDYTAAGKLVRLLTTKDPSLPKRLSKFSIHRPMNGETEAIISTFERQSSTERAEAMQKSKFQMISWLS